MTLSILEALADIGFEQGVHTQDFQIRCPIHKGGLEAKPSARVYVSTNSLYCFACGKSYNPVALIAAANDWEYHQALAYVQQRYGGVEKAVPTDAHYAARLLYDALLATAQLEGRNWLLAMKDLDELLLRAARGKLNQDLVEQILRFRERAFGRLASGSTPPR